MRIIITEGTDQMCIGIAPLQRNRDVLRSMGGALSQMALFLSSFAFYDLTDGLIELVLAITVDFAGTLHAVNAQGVK